MEINEFNLNKTSDNLSNNIINFMQHVYFLNDYWKVKKRIPDILIGMMIKFFIKDGINHQTMKLYQH